MTNLLHVPDALIDRDREFFETLFTASGEIRVERIISHGQTTPEGEWYDQEQDEWVMVVEGTARIAYPDGSGISLAKGDYLFLPRHVRHRVAYTSAPCVWLAIFGELRERLFW